MDWKGPFRQSEVTEVEFTQQFCAILKERLHHEANLIIGGGDSCSGFDVIPVPAVWKRPGRMQLECLLSPHDPNRLGQRNLSGQALAVCASEGELHHFRGA